MNWRVLDSGFNNGKTNMDVDIRLAESCSPDESVLRFYRWNPYCISLGANQRIEQINLEKAQHDNIDIVFRPTGGRAILHAEELTYSVIYPIDDNTSVRNLYHNINIAIIKGLIDYDSRLTYLEMEDIQPNFPNIYKQSLSALCFAFPAKSEIKYAGKKLVGSAQKKMKDVLLQHGSILCGNFHLRIVDYLNIEKEEIPAVSNKLISSTTDLFSILHEKIDYHRLIDSLLAGFRTQFAAEFNIVHHEEVA